MNTLNEYSYIWGADKDKYVFINRKCYSFKTAILRLMSGWHRTYY